LTVTGHLSWQACSDTVRPHDGISVLRQGTDRRSHGHLDGTGADWDGEREGAPRIDESQTARTTAWRAGLQGQRRRQRSLGRRLSRGCAELLASLLADHKKPEDLIGENGLLKLLTKLLVGKALDAELTEHLGHERHEAVANASGNTRNGKSKMTLKGEFGELLIEVPRDRHGSFEPQLIPKHQTRWNGFDDKIISLYARGMTVREIQSHPQEMYGAEVSPSLISL
jgi:putative transposase